MSPEEEALLFLMYEKQLQQLCRTENAVDPSRFTNRVLLSAQLYFKRFFLFVSPMEIMPQDVMLASIYLAGKVEDERIRLDDLVPKYSKHLSPGGLLSLEMRLLEVLAFRVVTHSPFRCLSGLIQELHAAAPGVPQDARAASETFEVLHRASIDLICRALCTDAPFLYPPQQIALAALVAADRAADAALSTAGAVDVGAWGARRLASEASAPENATGRTAPPLLEQLNRIELGDEATFLGEPVDLNSVEIQARLKQADEQLRRLTEALGVAEAAASRARDEEEAQRQRKRARDETSTSKSELMVNGARVSVEWDAEGFPGTVNLDGTSDGPDAEPFVLRRRISGERRARGIEYR